jgi:glycosyltransferase involved in cell wall biosynthesis
MRALGRVVPPGVEVGAFRPRARPEALREAADRLEADDARHRGRPDALDAEVASALERRDAAALDALADRYDQEAPDPGAPGRLRALAGLDAPIVGSLGKLIPQKGVALLLQAHRAMRADAHLLVVGFGSHREWLQALATALARGDEEALVWLRDAGGIPGGPVQGTPRHRGVTFTGRLDHRYAPGALAAMDVQVVPSILAEAFGMVAAEGAAAGALPMLARHSGLAEVAAALEGEVGQAGLFSYEVEPGKPGEATVAAMAAGVDRLLALPPAERDELRGAVSSFVAREWTWERNAARLLEAAGAGGPA